MLSDRKRELEHRLSATLEENDLLRGTVEELQDRVLILERQGHDKDLQVLTGPDRARLAAQPGGKAGRPAPLPPLGQQWVQSPPGLAVPSGLTEVAGLPLLGSIATYRSCLHFVLSR